MKPYLFSLGFAAVLAGLPASADVVTQMYTGPSIAIPDGTGGGLANVLNISGSSITSITNVVVDLGITGNWNGDLYATLQHDTGFSVLLNRVGRTSTNNAGFNNDGLVVTLDDSGANPDIHNQDSGGGPLIGTFLSDARNIDPTLVLDTDLRTADLSVFNGLSANGNWTLYIEDVSIGDTHMLESWGLTITGVPEASESALAMLAASGLLVARRRKRKEL